MQLTIEVHDQNELQLLLQYLRLLRSAKLLTTASPKPVEPSPKAVEPEPEAKPYRQPGFAKEYILYVAPDFDDTPPGFEEYMMPADGLPD